MTMRRLLCAFFFVLLAPFVGAQSAPAPEPQASADYVLRPSDLLQVKIFQEDDLTRELSVSQDFTISLPLIGTVDVRDRTVRQTEELIRDLYDRDYLVNPQVTLIVFRYSERTVNVIGAVNQPGAVTFPPERGLTLVDAISRAGGFSRLAQRRQVRLTRNEADGKSNTYVIDVDRLIDGNASNAWELRVGDVIFVPERIL